MPVKASELFPLQFAKVMSGALLGPTGYEATKDNVVSLQMSPDFVGSPFYPNDGLLGLRPVIA